MFVMPMHPWQPATIQPARSWEAPNALCLCKYRPRLCKYSRHDKSCLRCPRLAAEDALQCSRASGLVIGVASSVYDLFTIEIASGKARVCSCNFSSSVG